MSTVADEFGPLVTADILAQHLDGSWLVFDCRHALTDPEYGRRAYDEGHVPTARFADLDHDLAGAPGKQGRHPLPARDDLVSAFRRWGIEPSSTLVAYDDAGGMFASRFWWLARWLGMSRVAVLDGGIQAFTGTGASLERDEPSVEASLFEAGEPLTRVVEANDILSASDLTLIDARATARFLGHEEPIDPVAGHIPGAHSYPCTDNLTPEGTFKRDGNRFAELEGENVVSYCGSGVTATHNIVAMLMEGHPEPALYPGSWSEWVQDGSRAIATDETNE